MTNFIAQSIEHGLPVGSTPEASRRYMQWKEEDVGLLLSDLEQPGHYERWKQNKSGYSKRVAEEVFKSAMYHEAIKFKVRWLESRFKNWHQKLTAPDVLDDQQAQANTRGLNTFCQDKMIKEFPYYDRCKGVFDTNAVTSPDALPAAMNESDSSRKTSPLMDSSMEGLHMTHEPNSPTLNTPKPETMTSPKKRVPIGSHSSAAGSTATNSNIPALKKRKIQPYTSSQLTAPSLQKQVMQTHPADSIIEDRKIRLMELELEGKKMDHEERMQHMKLEQLRLEIELQKLKRYSTNPSE